MMRIIVEAPIFNSCNALELLSNGSIGAGFRMTANFFRLRFSVFVVTPHASVSARRTRP